VSNNYKKIKNFICKKNVVFIITPIRNKNEHGLCLSTKDSKSKIIIIIDPRKEFLSTLIHECLHGVYPSYSESKIKRIEKVIVNKSTSLQFKNFLLFFCLNAKLLRSETSVDDLF
jgi:hypothetical protein